MNNKKSYQQLREELDSILYQLENEDTDIDDALVLHKKGQELLKQMEHYLEEVSQAIKLPSESKKSK